jgi:hypothetical protein
MKHIIKAILIITALLTGIHTVYAGADIQDGLWEITSKMEMPGMPMEMPPVTFTQCMNSQESVPHDAKQNPDCKIKNTKVEGDTVSWDMQCSGRSGNMKSSGKITYKGSTFKGSVNAVADGMEMTQTMSGRRIGDCR